MDESAFNETIRQRMARLQAAAWHLEQYLLLTSGIETVEGKAEPVPPQIEPPPAGPPKLGKPLPKFKPGPKHGSKRTSTSAITYTPEQEHEILRRYEAGEPKSRISISFGHDQGGHSIVRVLKKHGYHVRTFSEQMKITKGRANGNSPIKHEGEECLR